AGLDVHAYYRRLTANQGYERRGVTPALDHLGDLQVGDRQVRERLILGEWRERQRSQSSRRRPGRRRPYLRLKTDEGDDDCRQDDEYSNHGEAPPLETRDHGTARWLATSRGRRPIAWPEAAEERLQGDLTLESGNRRAQAKVRTRLNATWRLSRRARSSVGPLQVEARAISSDHTLNSGRSAAGISRSSAMMVAGSGSARSAMTS